MDIVQYYRYTSSLRELSEQVACSFMQINRLATRTSSNWQHLCLLISFPRDKFFRAKFQSFVFTYLKQSVDTNNLQEVMLDISKTIVFNCNIIKQMKRGTFRTQSTRALRNMQKCNQNQL